MPAKVTKPSMLSISEAAEMLGVSQVTLRRWDAAGRFKARRHPINDYRMYDRGEVERLKKKIERGVAA